LFGDFNVDGYEDLIIDFQYTGLTGQNDAHGVPITKVFYKSLFLQN
jgi:hypothetical protein